MALDASKRNNKIIALVGWQGTGKDTVADYLANLHEFRRDSFAATLKDAVSVVFGWNRQLLDGRTHESRVWRELIDPWWAQRLNIPTLTPRWVLQQWGTQVLRGQFHDDIWIASLENKMRQTTDNVVVSDCRFPNEVHAIRAAGGQVIWVQRGPLPEWYECALRQNTTPIRFQLTHETMEVMYPEVHPSEWSWVGTPFDAVIDNNADGYDNLYRQLDQLAIDLQRAPCHRS